MRMTWDKLVGRGLALLLIVLFAAPCIACDDAVGPWLARGDGAVRMAAGVTHADGVRHATAEDALSCACLSDASKVRAEQPAMERVAPCPVLLPSLAAPAPPAPAFVARPEPVAATPLLLVHATSGDRAPPVR